MQFPVGILPDPAFGSGFRGPRVFGRFNRSPVELLQVPLSNPAGRCIKCSRDPDKNETMRKSRELLLRLYHDPRCRFSDVVVCYIDRGAPGDESCVEGDKILGLDSQYMEIESAVGVSPIPYHRITKLLYEGKPVWERGSPKEDTGITGT